MKVIVVGLGSMGKRRIRLMKQICSDISIIGVDISEERRLAASEEFGICSKASLDEVFSEDADCAFVCTSPLSHADIITATLSYGLHTFTEINLVADGYERNINLAKEKNLTLFLSSTFLYRDEIKYIRNEVKNHAEKFNYIYHVGQYLPDWHPWENYNSFFVSDTRTNGCRELLAIELPWIINTFGNIIEMKSVHQKNSKLQIPYDDTYIITFRHENGHIGCVCIDLISRKPVRRLELTSEELCLTWDGTPDTLFQFNMHKKESKKIDLCNSIDRLNGYAGFIIENAYQSEIQAFFETITKGDNQYYDMKSDLTTLKLIDEIEQQ